MGRSSRHGAGLFVGSLIGGCIVLVAAGLLLVAPVSADGGSVDCGSVRSASTTFDRVWLWKWVDLETARRLADEKCSRARDDRRNFAVAIGGVGALFVTGGVVSELRRRRRSRDHELRGDEPADRRVAWPIGLAGTLAVLVALGAGYGFMIAIGIAEVTVVLVVLRRRPRPPEVRMAWGITLTVLLALGAYLCLAFEGGPLPEPFHHPTGDAVADYCSSVLSPRPDSEHCTDWRRRRAIEAALLGLMALVTATATMVDAVAERRRSRDGHDDATTSAGNASA